MNIIQVNGWRFNHICKRKDIKLIRFIDNKLLLIDLTSDDFFTNKNHQIFSGDIIIVNPNTNRVRMPEL